MSTEYNLEENRLKSFETWPSTSPISPDDLAKSGFFATGFYLEAQCNWCRIRISDWQQGDEAMARHRRAEPNCLFITQPNSSNNVQLRNEEAAAFASSCVSPSSSSSNSEQQQQQQQESQSEEQEQQTPQTSDVAQVDLKIEMNRLATFKNWPNPNISPQSLAKAGFYYINRADQVKCAWCKGVIAKWEKGDNAFDEHQRFFPECPRVQLGPLIEIASDGIRELGIQQICPPKNTKYSCLHARMRTYARWPIPDIQNPEILSQAGFYYQEIDDQVRCFHCYGGLRSWQKEDDPWFEHAKWFPHCNFLKLVKGPNFTSYVQETERQSTSDNSNPRETTIAETIDPITNLDDAMQTEPVLRALEMGLNAGRILNATRRQLESCGKPYETTEELVEAVLEGQVDEEDDENGPEQSSSIVREVSRILNNIFNPRNSTTDNEFYDMQSTDDFEFGDFSDLRGLVEDNTYTNDTVNLPAQNQNQIETNSQSTSSSSSNDEAAANSNEFSNIRNNSSLLVPDNKNNETKPNSLCNENRTTEQAENENSVDESTSSKHHPPMEKQMSLEEENRKLKDARTCKVCMDDEVGVVFLPCGHLVTCVQCAPGVNVCPLCRSAIKGFVRTFLS